MKGGHLDDAESPDWLFTRDGAMRFTAPACQNEKYPWHGLYALCCPGGAAPTAPKLGRDGAGGENLALPCAGTS
ncbi:Hydroxymethylpyrimidine/phosphomethylpyrimidine kinase [Leclercia adecarboxylata]|uniref:Hydroxymethylpyrimidine/phosphomethylpyrimidine kinase n=1 Tax=Leclercia adecarboxylata TaxID=83655 RepID=A0A4V6JJK6_9ENTR|nr:Hydroxymethylpyrimidine/phosphomethylpyrimidine kinase [Leclercia adecarboxylata]